MTKDEPKKHQYTQFDIGEWARIKNRAIRIYEGTKAAWLSKEMLQSLEGIIVGATIKQNGFRRRASDFRLGEPPSYYFEVANTILLWEIKPGLLNKSVLAFADDIVPISKETRDKFGRVSLRELPIKIMVPSTFYEVEQDHEEWMERKRD